MKRMKELSEAEETEDSQEEKMKKFERVEKQNVECRFIPIIPKKAIESSPLQNHTIIQFIIE